jgi:hypothetical protein
LSQIPSGFAGLQEEFILAFFRFFRFFFRRNGRSRRSPDLWSEFLTQCLPFLYGHST